MSKIVQAVNAMVSNPGKISDVITGEYHNHEIYFRYDDRHKWSMNGSGDSSSVYYLHYYPGNEELEYIASLEDYNWNDIRHVSYNTKELGTKEAFQSFEELYLILQEKIYGMDDVLDDIINSDSA